MGTIHIKKKDKALIASESLSKYFYSPKFQMDSEKVQSDIRSILAYLSDLASDSPGIRIVIADIEKSVEQLFVEAPKKSDLIHELVEGIRFDLIVLRDLIYFKWEIK